MEKANHRFEVLDSWRGICALIVVLFHLQVYSHFSNSGYQESCFLFVDFFFVLSGFVIAANYRARLADGFGLFRFMLLRLRRVYPLYFTILAIFIYDEWVGGLAHPMATPAAFAAPYHSLDTIFANFLMLQCLGLYSFLSWNVPGWSVATEFWTYLIFALTAIYLRQYFNILAMLVLASALIFLFMFSPHWINVTFDYGMIRCLAGFSAGTLCWTIWTKWISKIELSKMAASLIELLIAAIVILFVGYSAQNVYSLLSPLVFSFAVLAFAKEAGLVSTFLKWRPFIFLGTISFSIYMTHYYLEQRLHPMVSLLENMFSTSLTHLDDSIAPPQVRIGANIWQGDLWTVFFLVLVIAFSSMTYYFVEQPARRSSNIMPQTARP